MDGGLIVGYREGGGRREVRFASSGPGGPWTDIETMQPFEVCALVRKGEVLPRKELYLKALERAAAIASRREWDGVPQGLAALAAYATDVADAEKDFAESAEYFCWATFERLEARKCGAVWLGRVAQELDAPARLEAAAEHYARVHELYERYRVAVGAGQESEIDPRAPATVAESVPLLQEAMEEEQAGLDEITSSLAELRRS